MIFQINLEAEIEDFSENLFTDHRNKLCVSIESEHERGAPSKLHQNLILRKLFSIKLSRFPIMLLPHLIPDSFFLTLKKNI